MVYQFVDDNHCSLRLKHCSALYTLGLVPLLVQKAACWTKDIENRAAAAIAANEKVLLLKVYVFSS